MDLGSRKPREGNPELRAGQRWSRQAGGGNRSGRNRSLNEPGVERVRREANYALSEEEWAEADMRALGWPDGVGRLKLAEVKTGRWQANQKSQWNGNRRQERPKGGPERERSQEKKPAGKSKFASGIELTSAIENG